MEGRTAHIKQGGGQSHEDTISEEKALLGIFMEDTSPYMGKKPNDSPLHYTNYPITQNPIKTVELLKHFTLNDKNLKYSTHRWEEGKFSSYENFMESIREEWKEISEDLKKQNNKLHAKISNFLFNDKLGEKDGKYYKAWGEKKLKFGWSSPELKEFMNLGEEKDPFKCPVPERIRALEKGVNVFHFEDYVDVFKNEIEIREDSKALRKLINSLWSDELSYDFNVTTEGLDGISFFTDVAYLRESLKLIFKNFKKRPEFPNIIITAKSDFTSNTLLIKVTQKDSKCRRSIDDPKIISPNGGDLGTIIKCLKGLADFSISATFQDNENYQVNLLVSNNSINHIAKTQKIDGFTYELKFHL